MENLIHTSCGTIEKPPPPLKFLPFFGPVLIMSAMCLVAWLSGIPQAIMATGLGSALVLLMMLDRLIVHARRRKPRVIEDAPLDELVAAHDTSVDTEDPPADEWLERLRKYVASRAEFDPEAALIWLELDGSIAATSDHIKWENVPRKYIGHETFLTHRRTGILLGSWDDIDGVFIEPSEMSMRYWEEHKCQRSPSYTDALAASSGPTKTATATSSRCA